MTTIIGIDPGSRYTGYGLIRLEGDRHTRLASGHLDLTHYPIAERLRHIYLGLKNIIQDHQPHEAAIEAIFMHDNPRSALKLGQARGAAIVALDDLPIEEYTPRQVKKSIVGYGAAEKEQVQFMVRQLLHISEALQADEADALAVALCHAQARKFKKMGIDLSQMGMRFSRRRSRR